MSQPTKITLSITCPHCGKTVNINATKKRMSLGKHMDDLWRTIDKAINEFWGKVQ